MALWRRVADVDLDLDSDSGFAIVADCVVNNSFTKYIQYFCEAIGKLIGRATSQLLGKICSYNSASWARELQQHCALRRQGEGAKNADHLFWPAMNLIDNFYWPSYPTISPILHLSGWENI